MKFALALASAAACLVVVASPAMADDCPPLPAPCDNPADPPAPPSNPAQDSDLPAPVDQSVQHPSRPPHESQTRFRATGYNDRQHCVSTAEFNSIGSYLRKHDSITRREVEARWEVTGRGIDIIVAPVGQAVAYKRCGYRLTETYYGVKYHDGKLWIQMTGGPGEIIP